MGIDMRAAVILGFEVHESDVFDVEAKTFTQKSCEHPNPQGLKFCGECGKKYKVKTRELKTRTLKPDFAFLSPNGSLQDWDFHELEQEWRGIDGVSMWVRYGDDAPRDRAVIGVYLCGWDPKYETFSMSFSKEDLKEKRDLVWKTLFEQDIDVRPSEIKVHVWGDQY